jgi:long-chain acyl-CoA synthetase
MPPSNADVAKLLTGPGAPFEIAEADVLGHRLRVWKNAAPSLRALLDLSRLHGDKAFLVYEDERFTFEEHWRGAAQVARVLADRFGVAKGDRVAIAMRNFPEWPMVFFGATAIGGVAVPLNAWWTGDELEYGLRDSGASVLFCDAERAARIAPQMGALPDLRHVVVVRPDEEPIPPEHHRFEELVGLPGPGVTLPDVALAPEDDATIFYTSGTTGRPKGALGTHRNICGNVVSLAYGTVRTLLRSGEKPPGPAAPRPQAAQLLSVPLFHATGCHAVLCGNVAFGGKLVMMFKWDPARALALIEREGITSFGGVPAMVWQVLEHPDFQTRDLSSVQSVGYGGAPAAPELVRRIRDAFPTSSPGQGYGLTETSSVTTIIGGADYVAHPDSVGAPVPVVDLRICDDDGKDVPIGEIGEVWIGGPNVVKGYWRKPEATAESFPGGWLRSGDVGRLDADGFLYLVDRAKDMLIRGGENVYCVEVESVLYEHPAVMDAAVVGIPHKVLGEEVGAVVQVVPGKTVSEKELQNHVASKLAAFKVPVRIELRSEPLPRNANGKILKRELKQDLEKYAR